MPMARDIVMAWGMRRCGRDPCTYWFSIWASGIVGTGAWSHEVLMFTTRRQFLKSALAGSIPLAVPSMLRGVGPLAGGGDTSINDNIIVAAPNSSKSFLDKADYVCTGDVHNDTFAKALKQARKEKKGIVLADGEFLLDKLVDYPQNNMTFVGQGPGQTVLKYVGDNVFQDIGILQNQTDVPVANCSFGNFKMDLGGKNNIIGIRPIAMQNSFTLPIWITNGAPWVLGVQIMGTPIVACRGNFFGPMWIDHMGWPFEIRANSHSNYMQYLYCQNIVYGGLVINVDAYDNYFDFVYTGLSKSGDSKYEPTDVPYDDYLDADKSKPTYNPFPVGISLHETGAPAYSKVDDNIVNTLIVTADPGIAMKAAVWVAGVSKRNVVRSLSIRGSYKRVVQNSLPFSNYMVTDKDLEVSYEVYHVQTETFHSFNMNKTYQ